MSHDDTPRPTPDPMQELARMFGELGDEIREDPTGEPAPGTVGALGEPTDSEAPPAPEELPDLFAFADTPDDEPTDEAAVTSGAEATVDATVDGASDTSVDAVSDHGTDTVDEDFDFEAPTMGLDVSRIAAEVKAAEAEAIDAEAAEAETSEDLQTDEAMENHGPNLETLVAALDAAAPQAVLPTAPEVSEAIDRRRLQRHIVFALGDTRFALVMGQVVEVGPVPAITPLPHVPAWLPGVTNLRGDILAVLDLRRFLGHDGDSNHDRQRMLVVQAREGVLAAGVVVDQVFGVASIDPDAVRPPTAPIEGPVRELLVGVTEENDQLLAILDAEKLLTAGELQQFAA